MYGYAIIRCIARSLGLIGVGLVIIVVQSSACIVSWWALRRGLNNVERYGRDKVDTGANAMGADRLARLGSRLPGDEIICM